MDSGEESVETSEGVSESDFEDVMQEALTEGCKKVCKEHIYIGKHRDYPRILGSRQIILTFTNSKLVFHLRSFNKNAFLCCRIIHHNS